MQKENISFNFGVPINIKVLNVSSYPPHYHSGIEIVLILHGSLYIRNGSSYSKLNQGDIAVIGNENAHSLSASSPAKCMIAHFDTEYYKKYFNNIENTFFMRELNENNDTISENILLSIKKQLLEISIAFLQDIKHENFKKSEYITKNLLSNILQHYQIFSLKVQNSTEEKNSQVIHERMQRILSYIYSNYDNKIKLEEIAEWENLNSCYLSHILKHFTGMSFQEMLNLIRVEYSERLLLNTSYKISEISRQIGFSAKKYYETYFRKWFHESPEQYRISMAKTNSQPDFSEYDNVTSYKLVKDFAQDGKFLVKIADNDPIIMVHADINQTNNSFADPLIHSIKLSNAASLLYENAKLIITDIKNDFKITKAGISTELLYDDAQQNNEYLTVANNINYLIQAGMQIFFSITQIDNKSVKALDSFLKFYYSRFPGNIAEINYSIEPKKKYNINELEHFEKRLSAKIQSITKKPPTITIHNKGREEFTFTPCLYDSFVLTPFAVDELIHAEKWKKDIDFTIMDSARKSGNILEGGHGLFSWNGFKKPWYFAYVMISKLNGNIIKVGKDYIITKNQDEIVILTYNLCNCSESDLEKIKNREALQSFIYNMSFSKEHIFEISGVSGDYKMTTYSLDQDCCLFSKWMDLDFPDYFSDYEEKILSITCHPNIKMHKIHTDGLLKLTTHEPSFGVTCITLKKI